MYFSWNELHSINRVQTTEKKEKKEKELKIPVWYHCSKFSMRVLKINLSELAVKNQFQITEKKEHDINRCIKMDFFFTNMLQNNIMYRKLFT